MISPLAHVDPQATIGKNVTIQPFAFIDKNVVIGDGCMIMSFAAILSGTEMGKNNKVYHHAVLGAEPQDFQFKGEESALKIGDNNHIRENVVVSRATHTGGSTVIGNDNFLMDKAHICHDAQLGNNCVIGIGSIVGGQCILSDNAILSGNVSLYQYCRVGSWAMIQGGARISKDVPPYVIIKGNPPAYHGVNASVLSQRLQMSDRMLRHIVNAYRLVFQGNFGLNDALQKIEDQIPMSEEIQGIIDFCRSSEHGLLK